MTTITEIRESNKAAGFHWFNPSSLRYFNSTIGRKVWEIETGALFVTSERMRYSDPLTYSVRGWNRATGDVYTVSQFGEYTSGAAARAAAEKMAGE